LTASEPAAPASSEVAAPAANRRRLIVLLLVTVVVVAAVFAAATALGGPGRKVETGVVVAVQATSLSNVQGFTIRTPDGRTVDFRIGALEDPTAFPPGHLAEHKVSLRPVRVTYIDGSDGPVAVRLEDAPAG
jgi:flagellar basal body-associated protein FliL